MSTTDRTPSRWEQPGVLRYLAILGGALGAIVLVLLGQGFREWSLLPVLAGLAGGTTRFAPVLLVLAVAMTVNSPPAYGVTFDRADNLNLPELILGGAVLGYVAAHYRLQSLLLNIFPLDPRRPLAAPGSEPSKESPKSPPVCRPSRLVTQREIGLLLLSLPFSAALARLTWQILPADGKYPGLADSVWQLILVAWSLGTPIFMLAGLIGYWRRQQMSEQEGMVLLQDVVWQETRGEQRRLNRWLAWAGLRARRRKEIS